MYSTFVTDVANSTAHRPSREGLAIRVLEDNVLLPVLIDIALNTKNKSHHKACWILELVFENNLMLIDAYLTTFITKLTEYKHEGAIRSVSKICQFLALRWKKQPNTLTVAQKECIVEACFDWLISTDVKVASKAYSMRALYILGEDTHWVHIELQRILTEDYAKHSAAYKSAAKELLQKFKI